MQLTINGQKVEAQEGQTVLEAAREAGIYIPTLCYHPAVAPNGSCWLCLVEVKAQGRTRLVTSCCYPAREGLEVFTDSEKVQKVRRGVMELLLARAPESKTLQILAAKLGVTESRLPTVTKAERDCILCGLCVAVCREVMGAAAISFVNRGVDRVVAPPFRESSEVCLGCGACAAVCPMGTIELRWTDQEVEVAPFHNRLPLAHCQECGKPIAGQPFSEKIQQQLGEELASAARLCDVCKRGQAARIIMKTSHRKEAPAR
jgi:predicted molibdopterin-dependent oxidoreductase YjgC